MYMASETAHVISACENQLKKEKICDTPFTVDEIRGQILKDLLTDADYLAPFEVTALFIILALSLVAIRACSLLALFCNLLLQVQFTSKSSLYLSRPMPDFLPATRQHCIGGFQLMMKEEHL